MKGVLPTWLLVISSRCCGIPRPALMLKRVGSLFLLTFRCALKAGLAREDGEDCALTFVQHVFDNPRFQRLDFSHQEAERYLRRCARNWVWDFCRQLARRKRRERAYSELNLSEETADPSVCVETRFLRYELYKRIVQSVQQLTPPQQALFQQRMLQSLSIQEIAARQKRTPHAIEQALYTLRCRLRILLLEQGMDEAEARSYLSESTPPPHGKFTWLKPGKSFWLKDVVGKCRLGKIFFLTP